MIRKIPMIGMVAVLVVLLGLVVSAPTNAQSVDSIIAQIVTARGGLDRLHAVQSEHLSGQIRIGPSASGPVVIDIRRPNSIRMEMTLLDSLIVRAYDGRTKTGWMINPFSHSRTPVVMSPEDTRNIAAEADLEGPLVDYASKGNRVVFVKADTLGVRPVYNLQVISPASDTETYYIDQQTHLPLRREQRVLLNGVLTDVQANYSDYRTIDGLTFPFHITSIVKGAQQEQELVFQSILLNQDEPDSRFVKPDSAAQ